METSTPAPLETWRPILGHDGRYEVSDLGRVRSLRVRGGAYDRPRPVPLLLRIGRDAKGYATVSLGRRGWRAVHRLVLEAFAGPCPVGHEGAHLDGDPSNARLTNLRWVTHVENEQHKRAHGTLPTGDQHYTRRKAAER